MVMSAKNVSAKVLSPSEAARSTRAKFDEVEEGKLAADIVKGTSAKERAGFGVGVKILHRKEAILSVKTQKVLPLTRQDALYGMIRSPAAFHV